MNKVPLIYLLPKNIALDRYTPTKREVTGHIRAWQKKFAFTYTAPAVRLGQELGITLAPEYRFPDKMRPADFTKKYQAILWVVEGLIQDMTDLSNIYTQELVNPTRSQIQDKDMLEHARYIYTTLCEQTPMLALITDPQNDIRKLQLFAQLVGWRFEPEDIQSVLFGTDTEREEVLARKLCAFQHTLNVYTQTNYDALVETYKALVRLNPPLKKISNPTTRINVLCRFFVLVGSLWPAEDIALALYGSPDEKQHAKNSADIADHLTRLGLNPEAYKTYCSWPMSEHTWQAISQAVYRQQMQDAQSIRSLFPVLQEDPITPSEQEILQAVNALRNDLPTSFIRKDEQSPVLAAEHFLHISFAPDYQYPENMTSDHFWRYYHQQYGLQIQLEHYKEHLTARYLSYQNAQVKRTGWKELLHSLWVGKEKTEIKVNADTELTAQMYAYQRLLHERPLAIEGMTSLYKQLCALNPSLREITPPEKDFARLNTFIEAVAARFPEADIAMLMDGQEHTKTQIHLMHALELNKIQTQYPLKWIPAPETLEKISHLYTQKKQA
ncbi:MAG: hypothetical protein ILP11_01585 [Alphaproteobacteria bacterium]|nr:hypothetical protein [Alphaproteobacteria bacterium]